MKRQIQQFKKVLCLWVLSLGLAFTASARTQSVISITPVSSVCKNDTAFTIQVNQTSGYFYGGVYVDSFGVFTPSLTSQKNNKVYYTMLNSGVWIKDSISVTVDSIPDASITAAGPFCQNDKLHVLTGAKNKNGTFLGQKFLSTSGVFYPSIALKGDHKVFYTFTDGNGCKNTDSLTIHVDSLPNAGILDPGPLCLNDGQKQIETVLPGGTFDISVYMNATGIFNTTLSDTGYHSIYHTITDGNGCTRSDSFKVRVNHISDASIDAAGPYCVNNGPIKLKATTSTNGYFTKTLYLDTTGNFVPNAAGTGSHKVYYNSRSSAGCIATDSIEITVNDLPDASISIKDNYCKNAVNEKLSGTVNSNGTFDVTPFLASTGHLDLSLASLGDHKVYYSVIDANGCSNNDSAVLTVDSVPNSSISAAGPYCQSSLSEQLVTTNNGTFTTTNYVSSSGEFYPNIAQEGIHKVYHSFTDGNGCSSLDSINIEVYTKPNADLTSIDDLCVNGATYTIIPVGGLVGKFTPNAHIDTAGNFEPSIAGIGNHKIYYSVTDVNNCSNTDSTTVTVVASPNAEIAPVGELCDNEGTIKLSGLVNAGGIFTTTTYLTAAGQFSPNLASIGPNKVHYTYTTSEGCTGTDSATIIVKSTPIVQLGSVNPLCKNDNTIQIPLNTGLGGSFTVTKFLDRNGLFNPSQADVGNNKVHYSITDVNGCIGKDSLDVLIYDLPDAGIVQPGNLCDGQASVQLVPKTNPGGQFTAQTYLTSNGIFNPLYSGVGNHPVEYTITDINGCTNSAIEMITVDALPDATIIAPPTICENDAPLVIVPNTPGGQFNVTQYIDAFGNFAPTMADVGLNKAVYSVSNANGCTNKDSINIEIHQLPNNSIVLNQDQGCEGFISELTTQSNQLTEWNINGDKYSTSDVSIELNAGKHFVSLYVEDQFGCSVSLDTLITIFSNPVADFDISNEKVYISNPEVNLYDQSEGDIVAWSWALGDNSSANQKDLTHRYADTGNFSVILVVEDVNGCTDDKTKNVEVLAEFTAFIPTSFTPNDDGKNDEFRPVGLSIEAMTFQLFNKWGQKLIEDNNFTSWDGRLAGEILPNGTYLYQIKFVDEKGRFHFRNGSLYLHR